MLVCSYLKKKNIINKLNYYENLYNNIKMQYDNTKNKKLRNKLLSKKIKVINIIYLIKIFDNAKINKLKFPLYPILIEIPIKAKIKHWQEEIKFRWAQ